LKESFTSPALSSAEKAYSPFEAKENAPSVGIVLASTVLISPDGSSFYSGQVNINKQKHGKGTTIHQNGTKYEGIWEDDRLNFGRYIDTEGNMFEGNFINGKLNGKGIHRTLEKYAYEGDFVENEKNGVGNEDTQDYSYVGDFVGNKKHGKGKKVFKILGETYIGDFIDNKANGNGLYHFVGGEKYEGTFEDDQMHGKGTYTWPDGSEYMGDYYKNLKHGNGIFKQNGKTYEGPFVDGKPHGKGTMTNSQGIKGKIEFSEGKKIKVEKRKRAK